MTLNEMARRAGRVTPWRASVLGLAVVGLWMGQALIVPAETSVPTPAVAAVAAPPGAPLTFADLAEQVSPSVVNITTSTMVASARGMGPMVPKGSPFEDFFHDFMDEGEPGRPRRSQALGSGFVISADGFIVTNNHVIDGADDIEIEFYSGDHRKAKVIGVDKNTDIALLKVDGASDLPFVPFGDSDKARVGDWVLAVGNPLGQGFSVSSGIVSARNRALSGSYDDYIQTDAAINRGNSGGPLFNLDGAVIGVNTAILSPNGGSIGIGFSMASNVVSKVVAQLEEYGETRRGWLGVRIQDVTEDMAEAMGLDSTHGALIADVPEGPARDAGLQAGDVVLTFDGHAVRDTRDLVRRVGDAQIGKAVEMGVLRDGKEITVAVTLGRRETAEGADATVAPPADGVAGEVLGMALSPLSGETREKLGLDAAIEGLVVTAVEPGSAAEEKGIQVNDVITEAGQRRVQTVDDLNQRIDEAREAGRRSLLLLVRTDGAPRFVALPIE